MTTVVCSHTHMASDSRAADDATQCSVTKIFRVRNGLLGIAGDMAPAMAFVEWFKTSAKAGSVPPPMEHVEALYLTAQGKILCFDGSAVSYEILDAFAAIGSGAPAALGALHAGASLSEAIKIAGKVDCGTGGKVRMMKLPGA